MIKQEAIQLSRSIVGEMKRMGLPPAITWVGVDGEGNAYAEVLDSATLEPLGQLHSEADCEAVLTASRILLQGAVAGPR